ncbi:MAG: Gfo/Idh/MocA family oxidoreductase [Clostridiaceae bacterium]
MNIAFAGFRHGHIFELYKMAEKNPELNIAAAWEEDRETMNAAEKKHGVKFTHKTYEELLADKSIDIVAIGNYYGIRGNMAVKALSSGKHVIADKPLCTSLEELDEIACLAEKTGLKVGCMLTMRYESRINAVREFVQSGKLGEIHNIYFGGQHPLLYGTRPSWYFEEGKHGGVINDIGIHGIDIARFVCGLRPSVILSARCWNAYAREEKRFLDSGQFMLEMDNGAGLIADISYAVPNSIGFSFPHYWEYHIWGSKGMVRFSINSEAIYAYIDGESSGIIIPEIKVDTDCLTDFINEINGKADIRLSTKEVLQSSRDTLLIQKHAFEKQACCSRRNVD